MFLISDVYYVNDANRRNIKLLFCRWTATVLYPKYAFLLARSLDLVDRSRPKPVVGHSERAEGKSKKRESLWEPTSKLSPTPQLVVPRLL